MGGGPPSRIFLPLPSGNYFCPPPSENSCIRPCVYNTQRERERYIGREREGNSGKNKRKNKQARLIFFHCIVDCLYNNIYNKHTYCYIECLANECLQICSA